ncbi:hypothetical protein Tco_0502057 [Tanacetum coccineum]
MENRENGRIIIDSVLNGPLVWPIVVQEDGTTRKKTYAELSATEKIQADCDLKATNIVLQGLPPDVYVIVNHHKVAKEIWDRVKLLMQGTKLSLQEKECKMYDEFDKFLFVKGETLYQYYWRFAQLINNTKVINMSMRPVQVNTKFLNSLPPEWSKFVTDIKLARDLDTTNYDQLQLLFADTELLKVPSTTINLDTSVKSKETQAHYSKSRDTATSSKRKGQSYLVSVIKGECTNPGIPDGQAAQTNILNNAAFQTEDLDAYDSDYDDVSNANAILMANLSNYGSDVISEVPRSKSYHNDMDNQSVHAMHDFEQTPVVDFLDNKITSDSNIISYS